MGKLVEKKRKKKGRPSLLDLQKRSLRFQKQQEQQQLDQNQRKRNPNPSFNPYAHCLNPPAARLAHRIRNPDPVPPSPEEDVDEAVEAASVEDDEDEDEPAERRKAKKLKLVVHLPHPDGNSSDAACFASESDGAATNKRNMDAVGKVESKNSSWKATEAPQGGTSDLGPTTPLPDKKLLEFILDRLQKKDTYGVFSEPVDPDALPDYHGIIEHPMDFGTVRKRLSSGAYKNLEQFEKDVFLISSNAMRYNAPDTIYFRQARSIHELAKKSFENLRQESDDSNPEPKIVRRGRPPGTGKSNMAQPVGRPSAEGAGSEFFSEASLLNASNGNLSSNPMNDSLRRGSGFHKPGVADISASAPQCFPSFDSQNLRSEHISGRNEDYSGTTIVAVSVWKGSSKSGKKHSAKDENWRDTHRQYQLSSTQKLPVSTAPVGERRILVPVGLHLEFAYARSLARFAANLGPLGWKLAAKRIEKVLPPGTKFGPGWVGETGSPQPSQRQLFLTPSLHPSSTHSNVSTASRDDKPSEMAEQECHFKPSPSPTSVAATDRFPDTNKAKASSQLCQITMLQPAANGFKAPLTPNLYEPRKFATPNATITNFGLYMQ